MGASTDADAELATQDQEAEIERLDLGAQTRRAAREAGQRMRDVREQLERELLEGGGAKRVACVSALVRDELERLYPECSDRLVLVPNGVDRARFHPRLRPSGERLRRAWGLGRDPVLLFAGADAERKGLGPLLQPLATRLGLGAVATEPLVCA